jgi:hypothetical protein
MTPAEFKERMAVYAEAIKQGQARDLHYLGGGTWEEAHRLLTECLRSLGYGEGCDIYEQI